MSQLNFYDDRCNLAAAFRLTARMGWHEAVANHFSLSISEDGRKFLINPAGVHFSRIKASDLIVCDADDREATFAGARQPDPTAWGIHGAFHRHAPHARACLHVHPVSVVAFSALKDPTLPPIDQNCARFYKRYGYDDGFEGMGFDDEGERIAGTLGEHRILVMGNHGVMAAADSVARAYDELYYFEKACATYMCAAATGLPLKVLSDNVAEATAHQWETYPGEAWNQHFGAMRAILDEEEPGYRD